MRWILITLPCLLFTCSCGVFDNPLHLPTWGAEFHLDENHDLDDGEKTEEEQDENPLEQGEDKSAPDVEADETEDESSSD